MARDDDLVDSVNRTLSDDELLEAADRALKAKILAEAARLPISKQPTGKFEPQAVLMPGRDGGAVLFTARRNEGIKQPAQALDELLEVIRITSDRSWLAATWDYVQRRVGPVAVKAGIWHPESVRAYLPMIQALPLMLVRATPFLWRDDPAKLTVEMARTLPPETTWRRDMLVEPIMYWAQETDRLLEHKQEGFPGHDDANPMIEAGLARMYSSLVCDSEAMLDAVSPTWRKMRQQDRLAWAAYGGGITSIRFMISDTGLMIPLPGVSVYGQSAEAVPILASELLFMTSKLASTDAGHVQRHARKRWERVHKQVEAPGVRVVGLRRRESAKPAEGGEEGGAKREYSVQWMVHAHWHRYHTNEGVVTKMVGDYLKGPSDKPLKVRPTVYHVNR